MHARNYKALTMYHKLCFFSNNYFPMQEYIDVLYNYTVNTTDSMNNASSKCHLNLHPQLI